MEIQKLIITEQGRSLVSGFMGEEYPAEIDFNWLMPVVIKIFQLTNIEGLYKQLNELTEAYMLMDLNNIHKSVVKFIQWYNTTQSKEQVTQ